MTDDDAGMVMNAGSAAGLDVGIIHQRPHRRCPEGWTPWNPLEDDGDALRLANKLWLQVRHVHGQVHAGHARQFWRTESWFPLGDQDAATRRAIVRAAAALAERMTPNVRAKQGPTA